MGDCLYYAAPSTKLKFNGSSTYPVRGYIYNRSVVNCLQINPRGMFFNTKDSLGLCGTTSDDPANMWSLSLEEGEAEREMQQSLDDGEGYIGNVALGNYIKFGKEVVEFYVQNVLLLTLSSDVLQAKTNFQTTGDLKAGNISLKQHIHGGVEPGSGVSGAPQVAP